MSESLNNHPDIPIEDKDILTLPPITRREFLSKLIKGGIGVALGYEAVNSISNYNDSKSIEKQVNHDIDEREYWATVGEKGVEALLPKELELFLKIKNGAEEVYYTFQRVFKYADDWESYRDNGRWIGQDWYENIVRSFEYNQIEPYYTRKVEYSPLRLIYQLATDRLTKPEEIRSLFRQPNFNGSFGGVVGFEAIGLSSQEVKSIVERMMPYHFRNATEKIVFDANTVESYSAQAQYNPQSKRYMVKILKGNIVNWENGLNQDTVRALLCHECSHNCDWERNPYLMDAERIIFFAKIIGRLKETDRYRDDYVETWKLLDRDTKKWNDPWHLLCGAEEYWADICELYFSHYQTDTTTSAQGDLILPKKDQEIIEWLLSRTDPSWLLNKK